MRCASAASISDVELGATFKPTAVRVVAIDALMLIPMAQIIAERHAASLNFGLTLVLLSFICKAFRALVVLFLLLILSFLLVILLTLFLLLFVLRLLLLLVITTSSLLLLSGLLGFPTASSLLFWGCH